jgi:hypothetical protein
MALTTRRHSILDEIFVLRLDGKPVGSSDTINLAPNQPWQLQTMTVAVHLYPFIEPRISV